MSSIYIVTYQTDAFTNTYDNKLLINPICVPVYTIDISDWLSILVLR